MTSSTDPVWRRFSPRPLLHGLPVAILDADYLPWESYDGPPGDQGMTGPDSPAWRVLGHQPAALLGGRPLAPAEVDRYWSDIAPIGERLGGTGVPRTGAEVAAYWSAVRGELADTEADRSAARAEARWILHEVGSWRGTVSRDGSGRVGALFGRFGKPFARLVAALSRVPIWVCANILLSVIVGMLPAWAAEELGIRRNRLLVACDTLGVMVVFFLFDLVAGDPEHVLRARRRCARTVETPPDTAAAA
ncbi:oxygenase MpaB family protein [Nocardia sp. AG03]|uniref:oxygenase MpaB family protein n=1 Tax=Nocardia sp. AG03 TaxID=3025312 RepID=UPI002418A0CD|nr:oxygenase MpaB family protein [Nocardia sp. AG03]